MKKHIFVFENNHLSTFMKYLAVALLCLGFSLDVVAESIGCNEIRRAG